MKIVKIKGFNYRDKAKQFKETVGRKAEDAVCWLSANKEIIAVVTPIAVAGISGAAKVAKGAHRRSNLRKEQELKELYCYDRSLGHYFKLKRPLSNNDWVKIARRRRNGERLSDILDSLRVLA